MATIGETIDAWGLPADAAQRLKQWLTLPENGYNLENVPDAGFFTISNEELQEAGLHTRQQRNLVLAMLETPSGAGAAPAACESVLHEILDYVRALPKDVGKESKAFSRASSHDAEFALRQYGFTEVDGEAEESLQAPPPGVEVVEAFPFWEYYDENAASADFSAYHKKQLRIMGTKMGRGGFDVKDLQSRKDLLKLPVGNKWYKGGLDSAVLPYAVTAGSAAHNLRVGFEHKQSQEDKDTYSAVQGREGSSKESYKGRPPKSNRGQAVIALMAAVAINDVPLDLVLTDAKKYMLLRFRGNLMLKYEDLSASQAYFAIAHGLQQDADLKAVRGKPSEELVSQVKPSMLEAHNTLKRKLEEAGVGEALQTQLASILNSEASLQQRLEDTYDIVLPWAPQLEGMMPPEVLSWYA